MFVLLAAGAGIASGAYGLYKYVYGSGTIPVIQDNTVVTVEDNIDSLPRVEVEKKHESVKTKEDFLAELKRKVEKRREGFELVKAAEVAKIEL